MKGSLKGGNSLAYYRIWSLLIVCTLPKLGLSANSSSETLCPKFCFCVDKRVHCDRVGLEEAPAKYPPRLEYLTLKSNRIQRINRTVFQALKHVRYMLLSDNSITWIYPGAFRKAKRLLTLSLMSNNLKKLPSTTFLGLEKLQVLTLKHNRLVNIHKLFQVLKRIKLLNLSNNKIRKIKNKTFRNNLYLQYLDLQNNKIKWIEKNAFYRLVWLKAVILENNLLMQLNLHFYPSKHLDYFDVNHCNLQAVPSGLPNSMGDLRLANNSITEIHLDTFNCTTAINLLDLNYNNISVVEDGAFSHFKSLYNIHMKMNKLTSIPRMPKTIIGIFMNTNNINNLLAKQLGGLHNLEYLVLKHNKIEEIKPKVLHGLKSLKGLYLNDNKINKIGPMAFYYQKKLEALDLSENPVKVIAPFSFFGLDRVRILRMSSVEPKFADTRIFSDFKQLVYLDLSKSPELVHKLANKPTSLDYFKSVEDLNFMEDNLQSLPSNFSVYFPMLRVVKLSGNPWHCDMSILWLANWIRKSRVEFLYRDHVTCASPPELKGWKLAELYFKDIVKTLTTTMIPTIPPTIYQSPDININISFKTNTSLLSGNIDPSIKNLSKILVPKERHTNRIEYSIFPIEDTLENKTDVSNKIDSFSNKSRIKVQNLNVTLWTPRKIRHKNVKWKKFYKRKKGRFKIIRKGEGKKINQLKTEQKRLRKPRNRGSRKSNNILGVAQNTESKKNLDDSVGGAPFLNGDK